MTFVATKNSIMKIVITGSLGHIGKPLTQQLVQKGHTVTVISSTSERRAEIEAYGARAAIGVVEDVNFITNTLTGEDAVYCMNPPDFAAADQIVYYEKVGRCFAEAIKKSGIKRVVYLSSYGAHLPSGTGFISGSYQTEKILNAIPNILLTHIRPTSFYYNLFGFINMIKAVGFIGTVYGGEDKLAMVSPKDIAIAISEEITEVENTKSVRYVSSDDRSCNEIATVLGKAIGIPELQWKVLHPQQVKQSLLQNGLPENVADNLIELGLAIHSGALREKYELEKVSFGKVKLEDFAVDFAAAYYNI